MTKFTVALLLSAIALSEAKPSNILKREGGIRGLKTNKSGDVANFPTCDATGSQKSASASKAAASKGGCKSKKSASKSGTTDTSATVECGQTYTSSISLSSSLLCADLSGGEAALTLSGADAVLDCSGFSVSSGEKNFAKNVIGVKLENGASAVNCLVKGFGEGFLLADGE